jgi:hypothetical protein
MYSVGFVSQVFCLCFVGSSNSPDVMAKMSYICESEAML